MAHPDDITADLQGISILSSKLQMETGSEEFALAVDHIAEVAMLKPHAVITIRADAMGCPTYTFEDGTLEQLMARHEGQPATVMVRIDGHPAIRAARTTDQVYAVYRRIIRSAALLAHTERRSLARKTS